MRPQYKGNVSYFLKDNMEAPYKGRFCFYEQEEAALCIIAKNSSRGFRHVKIDWVLYTGFNIASSSLKKSKAIRPCLRDYPPKPPDYKHTREIHWTGNDYPTAMRAQTRIDRQMDATEYIIPPASRHSKQKSVKVSHTWSLDKISHS